MEQRISDKEARVSVYCLLKEIGMHKDIASNMDKEGCISVYFLLKEIGMDKDVAKKIVRRLKNGGVLRRGPLVSSWKEVQAVLKSIPKYRAKGILFLGSTRGKALKESMEVQDVMTTTLLPINACRLLREVTLVDEENQEVWAIAESWEDSKQFLKLLEEEQSTKYVVRNSWEKKGSPGHKTVLYACHRGRQPYWRKSNKDGSVRKERGSKRVGCESQITMEMTPGGSVAISMNLKHINHAPETPQDSLHPPASSHMLDGVQQASQVLQSAVFVDANMREKLRENLDLLRNYSDVVAESELKEVLDGSESLLEKMRSQAKLPSSTANVVPDFQATRRTT